MKIAVFLTLGNSLKDWQKAGILERELALYAELGDHGVQTNIISYANTDEAELVQKIDSVNVFSNIFGLHPRIYSWLLSFLHWRAFDKCSLLKTNQMLGSHVARRVAAIHRKPLIVRQGYGYYEHRVEEHGRESYIAKRALNYERKNLRAADHCVFTTHELATRATNRHRLFSSRVSTIPNFVNDQLWHGKTHRSPFSTTIKLCFFGRLTQQKNLLSLIKAVAKINAELTIIGDGPEKKNLKSEALELKARASFVDRVPQQELYKYLNKAHAFILPSHYEGHPKALIEAMFFGCPIIGNNSPGIQQFITHQKNGILFGDGFKNIHDTLIEFSEMTPKQRRCLGVNARKYVQKNFLLTEVARKEYETYQKIIEY